MGPFPMLNVSRVSLRQCLEEATKHCKSMPQPPRLRHCDLKVAAHAGDALGRVVFAQELWLQIR